MLLFYADYKKWTPLIHSCDPNLIFNAAHSLDIVACRFIAKVEVLTIDYATFCAADKAMPCQCASSACRKVVVYNEEVQKKYERNSFLRPKK